MASMASGFGCPLKAPPLASRACLASPSDRPSSFFLSLSWPFFFSVVAPLPSFRLAFAAGRPGRHSRRRRRKATPARGRREAERERAGADAWLAPSSTCIFISFRPSVFLSVIFDCCAMVRAGKCAPLLLLLLEFCMHRGCEFAAEIIYNLLLIC